MPRRRHADPLTTACVWLSECLHAVVNRYVNPSAATAPIGDSICRLAIALEAFGNAMHGGDRKRLADLFAELDTSYGQSRRSKQRRNLDDPIDEREGHRWLLRKADRLRKELARLEASGASRREQRAVREELEALERFRR